MSDAATTERALRLTPQQEDALSVSTANVALGAGAGCGKTSVLTERFLRFLDGPDRRPLRSIVALTFTDKAARELRERVRVACRKKLDTGEDRRYWRRVLRGLEAAPIGTFHAFCGNILRRFPIEAGVEPGFRVLEESIAPSLLDLSLSACFRSWLAEQNEDLKTLAIEHGLTPVRDALLDLVGDRRGNDYSGWAVKSEEEILQIWHSTWTTEARQKALGRVVEAAEPILRLAGQYECSHKVMKERLAFLRQVLPDLPQAADPDLLLDEVVANARVQGGGNKDHWPSEEVFAEVKDELTRLREKIKRYQKSASFSDEISRLCAQDGLRFARLAATAEQRYLAAKREQSYLDFDDLLLMTRDLLAKPGSPALKTLQGEISV
ncbi:MAG TPA: UvrD-helicase domain-containing protein, partial [Isosphaeraceae bacterium]|nr:UvrD-helicase domain-containing protein [Isosphaeraceae bacterium]